jgi:hypothetical protein
MKERRMRVRWASQFLLLLTVVLLAVATGLAQSPATSQPGPAPKAPVSSAPNATPSAAPTASPAAASAAIKSAKIEVPVGTHLPLVLHNGISTRSARPGDPVYFETLFPIMVDGKVVIPAGSYVSGEVTESKRPGRVKGRGELMLRLNTMILPNGYQVNLNAEPRNADTGGNESTDSEGKVKGDSSKGTDAATIAGTTLGGAGLGGIVGGAKGAGIGAGIGGAAGLLAVLVSRGPEAEMPRGTTVEAVINRPIFLDADKVQFTGPGQASALAGPPNREPVRIKPAIPFPF